MSNPVSHTQPNAAVSDAIDAATACAILGEPQSSFELRRRALEMVLDRATGARGPVPDFPDKQTEREWRARACLIVPEWGGIKLPFGRWVYSRAACIAFRERRFDSVIASLPGNCAKDGNETRA
jgi:hypothetical protein